MNLLEMEDHHHHQEYSSSMMGDLRQLMTAPNSTTFPSSLSPQPPIADLFPGHPNLTSTTHHHSHYHNLNIIDNTTTNNNTSSSSININMNMMTFPPAPLHHHHQLSTPPALHDFPSSINVTAASTSTPPLSSGLEGEADTTTCGPSSLCFPADPSNGRWPRQETLTLLQIRSRLHHKFKDANQKGPLWDELSRIMCEEFGYQRSGKKCREKFENLYKYYKKTKEGKAGRQDGKHYRFFRQLEALCGENNSNPSPSTIPEAKFGSSSLNHSDPSQTNQEKTAMFNHKQHHCESTVSLSNNSTELETSSSSEEDHHNNNVNDESAKRRKRRWKRKIRDFIDSQMKEVMEKQEAWLERVMKTLEEKEKERVLREEEWSRNEAERAEREHKFWAKERAWIEARDSALMEALQKLTGIRVVSSQKELEKPKEEDEEEEEEEEEEGGSEIVHESWEECEMSTLVQIRGEIVHESGYSSEEAMWEEVATKMASFGYQKTASMCRRKWQNITNPHHLKQAGNNNSNVMKRSENSSSTRCFYFHTTSPYNQGQGNTSAAYSNMSQQHQPHASSPSNSNVGDASHSDNSCFPFFMCEGENLWENYGLNLNKGNRNP